MLHMPKAVPMGASWIYSFPQQGNYAPPYSPVRQVGYKSGTRAVEWLYAEIRPGDIGRGTSTDQDIRKHVRSLGRPNNDAGHIVGKNQGGPGREKWNIFPQSGHINRGAYAREVEQLFNMMAKSGGRVRIWWLFHFRSPLEPTRATSFSYIAEGGDGTLVSNDLVNP